MKLIVVAAAFGALSVLTAAPAAAAGKCDWYIVLNCGKSQANGKAKMNELGGPGAGGGAGLKVVNTANYPNFRKGFFCVVDGPYNTQDDAMSVAWAEAVPDAYVKKGCK
jgi:hypothetical protein